PPEARALEFPDAVLVPGLVNCHTHLELTHLAGKNAEREFAPWIRAIRALKDATTPEEFSRSAEQGVRDCWAAGDTCVADTGSTARVRSPTRCAPAASPSRLTTARRSSISCALASCNVQRGGSASIVSRSTGRISNRYGMRGRRWLSAPAPTAPTATALRRC